MSPSAIIIGASGQDGLLISSILTLRGMSVVGVTRDVDPGWRKKALPGIRWIDWGRFQMAWPEILKSSKPRVIIQLAGNSSVEESLRNPDRFIRNNLAIDSAVLNIASTAEVPLVVASSSQVFASGLESVGEETKVSPSSPYGMAKLEAHRMLVSSRSRGEASGSSLFLFNHESPLRRSTALSQRVASHLVNLKLSRPTSLVLANSNWVKDYSWAPDFALAICSSQLWESNTDFVLASGKKNTMGDMVAGASEKLGLGAGENTELLFGDEPPGPIGNAEKARNRLGFKSRFSGDEILYQIVKIQMEAELLSLEGSNRVRYLVDQSLASLGSDLA